MAVQFSVTVRNAMLQAVKDTIGSSILFRVFGSSAAANCAAADPGTILGHFSVSGTSFGTPSGGVMAQSGSWTRYPADDDGTVVFFRIYESTGTTCHIQGSVGTSGADMIVDSTTVGTGDKFNPGTEITVTSFNLTEGNA